MPYVDNEWIRNENNLNLLKSGKLIIKSANYAEKISSLTSSTRRRLIFLDYKQSSAAAREL